MILRSVGTGFVERLNEGVVGADFVVGKRLERDVGHYVKTLFFAIAHQADAGADLVGASREAGNHGVGLVHISGLSERRAIDRNERVRADAEFSRMALGDPGGFEGSIAFHEIREALGGIIGILFDVGGNYSVIVAGFGEEVAAARGGGGKNEHGRRTIRDFGRISCVLFHMRLFLPLLFYGIFASSLSAQKILFIKGGTGTVGFFEGGSDEQGADVFDFRTSGGNHSWGEFGSALVAEGFEIEQLAENPTTGNDPVVPTPVPLDTLDLAQYAVIVFGSNNAEYTTAQIDAFMSYISGGGAALFISDANFGQDWPDAPTSDQQFFDRFGLTMNQDRGTYSIERGQEFVVPAHPILNGVDEFDGEGVSPITVSSSVAGVTATIITEVPGGQQVRRNDNANGQGSTDTDTSNDGTLVVATFGAGRIAGHFDRNTFFNLNGAGTNINRFDNEAYGRNLINWLAGNPDFDAATGNYAPRGHFPPPSTTTLTVEAKDPDGSIASVAIPGIGTDNSVPYQFDIVGLPFGENSLTATITDNEGATTEIRTTINVEDPSDIGLPLDRSTWVLTANRSQGETNLAIDGDVGTRWPTRQPQEPGQVFSIDFGSREIFERIVLDTEENANDYPRGYIVRGSDDNINFTPIATGGEPGGTTTISLPAPVTYRYLSIEQTGSSSRNWWSIHEINLFAPPVDSVLPFVSWQQFYFGDSPPEILEDIDEDGLDTLEEFAFNLNPTTPDSVSQPIAMTVRGGAVEMTFSRWKEPNGVTYEMESSGDLNAWDNSNISIETVGPPVDNNDGTETVTLRATVAPGLQRQFVRLKLTLF